MRAGRPAPGMFRQTVAGRHKQTAPRGMKAFSLLLLLLLLPACARPPRQFDRDFIQARDAMWRGELADAQQQADDAAVRARVDGNVLWHWRFRLLAGEIAILRRDFSAAELVIKASLPEAPEFDGLRARRGFLEAKLHIEQGNIRLGHETLSRVRELAGTDPALALEVERLDGQALL